MGREGLERECAHTHVRTKHQPQENSSLPPFRGEVRWGVRCIEPAPTALLHPDRHFRHSRAPIRRSCLCRNDGGGQGLRNREA